MKYIRDAVIRRLSIEPRSLHQEMSSVLDSLSLNSRYTRQSRIMAALGDIYPNDRSSGANSRTCCMFGGSPTSSDGSAETDVEITPGFDVTLFQGWPNNIDGWRLLVSQLRQTLETAQSNTDELREQQ
jgi:hypothetical protein